MSDLMNDRLTKAISGFNDEVAAETKEHNIVVTVTKSQMLTVMSKGAKSHYKKEGFLGGEKIIFSRVYYGKKNTPIFVFTPKVVNSEYLSIEIPFTAVTSVTDFWDSYQNIVNDMGFNNLNEMFMAIHADCTESVTEEVTANGVQKYGAVWGSFA